MVVHVPAAQPAPRVPRSRRDDRYQTGRQAGEKRATAGYVVSIQDTYDTVTVDVLDEQLSGVIPLGEMPPVGAIVEVEARGDLLVIPFWYPGPPPATIVELPAQNIRGTSGWNGGGLATVVGGPMALFTRGADSYVHFHYSTATYPQEPNVTVGKSGSTDVMGFDSSVIPAGVTITSIRWLAEGWCDAHTDAPINESDFFTYYGLSSTVSPLTNAPLLFISYGGDPFSFGGYNLSTFPVGSNGPLELAPGEVTPYSYTYPGSSPARGALGLGPDIKIVGWPYPYVTSDIYLSYLALQVTYEE